MKNNKLLILGALLAVGAIIYFVFRKSIGAAFGSVIPQGNPTGALSTTSPSLAATQSPSLSAGTINVDRIVAGNASNSAVQTIADTLSNDALIRETIGKSIDAAKAEAKQYVEEVLKPALIARNNGNAVDFNGEVNGDYYPTWKEQSNNALEGLAVRVIQLRKDNGFYTDNNAAGLLADVTQNDSLNKANRTISEVLGIPFYVG